jgi:xylose isomerase
MAYFPEIPKIPFEGPKSKNPLAFKHYNPEELIEGRSMRELLRFAVAYWHTFRGQGSDPFGPGTMVRPWEGPVDNVENAQKRVRVAFEVGTDLDIANVLVQNRVSQAQPFLPEDVKRLGLTIKKSLSFPLMLVALRSPNGSLQPSSTAPASTSSITTFTSFSATAA